jgi:large subunit ribosomal protein L4
MKVKKYTLDGEEKGSYELPPEIFGVEVNESLTHSVVKLHLANQRQGTAKTKGRSEVSGGGRKPFKQKGTGRARAGSNASPLWVRGGKAFGPSPRSYGCTIPKKMRKAALCSAFTDRAKEGKIVIIDEMKIDQPKTKIVNDLLNKLSILHKRNLLLIGEEDKNLYLSGRNIKNVLIKNVKDVNAHDILSCENVIFSTANLIDTVKEVMTK